MNTAKAENSLATLLGKVVGHGCLSEYNVKLVNGVYGGHKEVSLCVETRNPRFWEQFVRDVCKEFKQESYLRVSPACTALLLLVDGREDCAANLGKMVEVTKEEASWTDHSEINGQYFICR